MSLKIIKRVLSIFNIKERLKLRVNRFNDNKISFCFLSYFILIISYAIFSNLCTRAKRNEKIENKRVSEYIVVVKIY